MTGGSRLVSTRLDSYVVLLVKIAGITWMFLLIVMPHHLLPSGQAETSPDLYWKPLQWLDTQPDLA
jgi:hypothetical protein